MRTIFFSLILVILNSHPLSAQFHNPVSWTATVEKAGVKKWKVLITATLEDGWYIYSQHMEEGGPVPTKITFARREQITFKDKPREHGELQVKFEDVFGMETKYYKGKVVFEQEVLLNGTLPIDLTGEIEYMICNGEVCLPPTTEKFWVVLR